MSKINYLQQTQLNNFYSKSNTNMNQIIWDSIETADESLILALNSKITNTYRAKINLLYNLLHSTKPLPLTDAKSVIKFFNIIAPLGNEFSFGCFSWNFKLVGKRLYVQNSVSKLDLNDYLRYNFLNPIKRVLKVSNVKFNYYQLKSARFYRSVDVVYVIDF
jgi:hypothetical protein